MRKTTEQITNKLLGKLPNDADSITTEELLTYGIPDFLVKRIKLELESHLLTSLNLHGNKWVDTKHGKVRVAWQNFLDEIKPLAHLPLSYAKKIIHKAVADVLLMLVEPRASLTKFIFSDDNQLTYGEVTLRCEQIPVYRHFGSALPRFMEKKSLETISQEQCSQFITALDEKLISRYTTSNWEKLLEPWVTLIGPEIDPALLHQFFNDKDEEELSELFARQHSSLALDSVVRIITRRENSENKRETEPAKPLNRLTKHIRLKEEISEETIAGAVKDTQDFEENSIIARARRANMEEENTLTSENLKKESDDKVNALFSRFQSSEIEGSSDEEEIAPIWKRYITFEPDDDDENNKSEEVEELEEVNGSQPSEPKAVEYQQPEIIENVEETKNENNPPVLEEHNVNNPELKHSNSKMDIFDYVGDNKEYYVDNLFGGDDDIFHDALEDLETCNDWKDAVHFLTEDIFRRNFIDIYSEPAVDFTDMLQEYFKDK